MVRAVVVVVAAVVVVAVSVVVDAVYDNQPWMRTSLLLRCSLKPAEQDEIRHHRAVFHFIASFDLAVPYIVPG